MKRFMAWVVMVSLLLGMQCCAAAADLGVIIIDEGEDETKAELGTLDNLKLKTSVDVEEFGTITPMSCEFVDDFYTLNEGRSTSGTEADYLFFRVDFLNTTLEPMEYLAGANIEVVFQEKVRYQGWCHQFDYDKSEAYVIRSSNEFPIKPYYVGHYVFGCTLPNAIVNSKEPLKMIITLADLEMTYNIR